MRFYEETDTLTGARLFVAEKWRHLMATTIKMLSYEYPNEKQIEVYGISDLHIGHEGFNEPEFQKLVRHITSEPNNYVILCGDIVDNQVKSSVGSPFDSTMRPSEQRKIAAEILYPLRDRILCIVPGNHEEHSVKDTDTNPAEMIAERLDLSERYRRDIAFLAITVGKRPNHTIAPPNYSVCVMHGKGAGRKRGSGLTGSDDVSMACGADLFIMGHTHAPAQAPGARLICNFAKKVMTQKNYQVMINTAWLDYVGYGVRGMYRPSPISISRATLYGNEFGIETHNRI